MAVDHLCSKEVSAEGPEWHASTRLAHCRQQPEQLTVASWGIKNGRCAVQYDLTWFINPKPPKYYNALALEHGYTRGSATATELHITVRSLPHTAIIVQDGGMYIPLQACCCWAETAHRCKLWRKEPLTALTGLGGV